MKRLILILCAPVVFAQTADLFDRLEWRSIGPAAMGGRTTDVEGIPGVPGLVYVATASGGLWKTVNGGATWTPIFDHGSTISIGNIAVDPHNSDVIWLGAGEANARNSVSFGDGVYKTLDGGKTWRNLGLRDTHHISRIVINPLNTNNAYVCALGHNTGPNDERGVFMTNDGGESWKKVLYIDADHGCADMDIDVNNPNILYATMWKFWRRPWTFISGDEKTAVYRSLDAGRTWTQLSAGLPEESGTHRRARRGQQFKCGLRGGRIERRHAVPFRRPRRSFSNDDQRSGGGGTRPLLRAHYHRSDR